MKIKLTRRIIEAAANDAHLSPEEYVSCVRTISTGKTVCAHLVEKTEAHLIFEV